MKLYIGVAVVAMTVLASAQQSSEDTAPALKVVTQQDVDAAVAKAVAAVKAEMAAKAPKEDPAVAALRIKAQMSRGWRAGFVDVTGPCRDAGGKYVEVVAGGDGSVQGYICGKDVK